MIIKEPTLTHATPVVHTPSIVSSPSATATSVVSPTSTSAPYGGSLLFNDPLQNNDMNRWDSNAGCRFIENVYQINSTSTTYYQGCAEHGGPLSNIVFQVQIVLTRGSVGGFEFRYTDSTGGYYFSVGWDGEYVFKTDKPGNSTNNDHVIATGQIAPNNQLTYELVIVANKSSFKAHINNTSISLPNDSTYTSGYFLLFVDESPFSRTTATQAIFSDLKVWVL